MLTIWTKIFGCWYPVKEAVLGLFLFHNFRQGWLGPVSEGKLPLGVFAWEEVLPSIHVPQQCSRSIFPPCLQ